jgi:hypothetical protein
MITHAEIISGYNSPFNIYNLHKAIVSFNIYKSAELNRRTDSMYIRDLKLFFIIFVLHKVKFSESSLFYLTVALSEPLSKASLNFDDIFNLNIKINRKGCPSPFYHASMPTKCACHYHIENTTPCRYFLNCCFNNSNKKNCIKDMEENTNIYAKLNKITGEYYFNETEELIDPTVFFGKSFNGNLKEKLCKKSKYFTIFIIIAPIFQFIVNEYNTNEIYSQKLKNLVKNQLTSYSNKNIINETQKKSFSKLLSYDKLPYFQQSEGKKGKLIFPDNSWGLQKFLSCFEDFNSICGVVSKRGAS